MDLTELDLTTLSDDDLAEFAGDLADIFGEMTADGSVELSADDEATLAEVTTAITAVDDEITDRASKAANTAKTARLAEFAAAAKAKAKEEVAPEAPAAVVEPEPAPEAKPEPAAKVELAAEIAPAGLQSEEIERPAAKRATRIIASDDLEGVRPGTEFGTLAEVANAFVAKRKHVRGSDAGADGYQFLVASVLGDYDEDRTLGQDVIENERKIQAVNGPEAITASGGICAPLEPYYNLQTLGSAERPIKAALANFRAERGGITFMPSPKLTDLNGSGITVTAAQDAAGYGNPALAAGAAGAIPAGGSAFKPSLKVACGAAQSVTVKAITRSLEFGNFGARTYPEQVQAWIALSITHHARRAETELLDQIGAASTAVTAARTYGAARTLMPQIDQAVAAYRSRHRMGENTRFRVVLPIWAKSLLRSDLARNLNVPDFEVSDDRIVGWMTRRGVNVSFHNDGATGAGQVFGAQTAGALLTYPSTIVWYLFIEGSFLFLDGGALDLGLVRDSTLNSTNDYRIFVETFEAVAHVGVESLKITSTVIANGAGPTSEAAIIVPV